MSDSYPISEAPLPQGIESALKAFDLEADEIVCKGVLYSPGTQEPSDIYHYTTNEGLRGILKPSGIWLSDIFSLNDRYELRHGLNLATDILVDAAKGGPCEYLEFAEDYKERRKEEADAFPHFFACSFSVRGNDHDQWSTYASDGRGYALGFATNLVKVPFASDGKPEISGGAGFLVEYDDDRLSEICRQLIAKALPLTSQIRRNNPRDYAQSSYWSKLMRSFSTHVLHASVYFKGKKYEQEGEFRLLWIQQSEYLNGIQYRQRNDKLIKYRKFNWRSVGSGVLRKIVIGPAADYDKARAFAERCLKDCGLSDVEIVPSGIPYQPCNSRLK